MLRGGSREKNFFVLLLFVVTGAVVGGILGELLRTTAVFSGVAPYFIRTFPILDLPMVFINLYVMEFGISLKLHPNLISIIGMVVAGFLYRRF